MSDNIPFDIQIEIIKKVADVKSLIRFRSVSKPWKSFIDSHKFIHDTDPHRLILRYKDSISEKYICLVDDKNNDTLTHHQEFDPTVPVLIKELNESRVVGSCHGLFCVYGVNENGRNMVVLWNPSIRKCVGMVVPHVLDGFGVGVGGFGVCPVTNDPMIVRIPSVLEISRQVEVFTLSSGVWSEIPSSKLFSDLIVIMSASHVVIDRFIYWIACENNVVVDDGAFRYNYKILSFDMIVKEFKVVDVPCSLTKQFYDGPVTISKLRESLVLLAFYVENVELDEVVGGVWIMEHDGVITSFRKLFTFDIPDSGSIKQIRGYRNTGEPIIDINRGESAALEVYSPVSKHINNLGIYGEYNSFFMGSYMETLLLLDHEDCFIYDYILKSDLLPHEEVAGLVIKE